MENPTGVDQTDINQVDRGVAASDTDVESVSSTETSEGVSQEADVNRDEAGKLDTIIAERERRQQAETRAKVLEEELKQVRNQVPQPQRKEPFDGMADDDIVQVSHVKEYLNTVRDEFRNEFQRQKVETSQRIAAGKYADYREVIDKLPKIANQTQIAVILNGNDPAETAYWFVKSSPDYINSLTEKTKQEASRQTIDSINQHTKKQKTLSNVGGGKMDTKSIIRNLSDDEFDKLVNDVKQGKDRKDVFGK